MMRALIVDDEVHARGELKALLDETGQFQVIGDCANAFEALKAIKRDRPDVVFLDIQMPVVSGFELLSMIDPEIMPIVVFVTAYDEYALKAFEENALDYLLKPVEKDRLTKTVHKLKKMLGEGTRPAYQGPEISRIPCVLSNRIKLINAADVECVRSDIGGVYVVCSNGEFFTELTLKVLEARTGLIRCHKQYLVNIDRVDEIILHENLLADMQMKSGRRIPVSRRYLRKIKGRFGL
jgi:two-component system, LytTR family, response regulator